MPMTCAGIGVFDGDLQTSGVEWHRQVCALTGGNGDWLLDADVVVFRFDVVRSRIEVRGE